MLEGVVFNLRMAAREAFQAMVSRLSSATAKPTEANGMLRWHTEPPKDQPHLGQDWVVRDAPSIPRDAERANWLRRRASAAQADR